MEWAIVCTSTRHKLKSTRKPKSAAPAPGGQAGSPDEYCDYAAVAAAEWSDDEVDKVAPAVAGCKRSDGE